MLTSQSGSDVKLNCCWESPRDGELDHDSDLAENRLLHGRQSWSEKTVETTFPDGASRFFFSVMVAKNASVLFDDFSFQKVPRAAAPVPTEPTLTVSPTTFTELSTQLNTPVAYPTVTLTQANLDQPVTITLTGKDAKHFSASVESVPPSRRKPLIFTYNPTVIGRHTATVTIESAGHYELTQTFSAEGLLHRPGNNPALDDPRSNRPPSRPSPPRWARRAP